MSSVLDRKFASTLWTRGRRLLASGLLWAGVAALAAAPLDAQILDTSAPAAVPEVVPPLEERLADVTARMAELRATVERSQAETPEAARAAAELAQLETIEALLRQQVSLAEVLLSTQADAAEATRNLEEQRLSDSPQPPPYTFLVLESLRQQVRDEAARLSRAEENERAARAALATAQADREAKERARRLVKERSANSSDPAASAHELRTSELESQFALETVRLREVEASLQALAREISASRLEALQGRLDHVAPLAELTPEDRSSVLIDLARREGQLQDAAAAAQRALDYLSGQWVEAKRKLDQAPSGDRARTEEVETLKRGQAYRRAELAALAAQQLRLGAMRTVWERRFSVFSEEAAPDSLEPWKRESQEALRNIEVEAALISGHVSDVRNDLVTLQGQTTTDLDPEVARWIDQRVYYARELAKIHEENFASLERLRRLHLDLLDDLGASGGSFSFGSAASSVWRRLVSVWSYELAEVEDRPITVGKIVKGVFLLVLGLLLSKRASRFLGRRLLPRLGLTGGGLHAYQSLFFYVLVVSFTLIALKIVNVPLTAFTILGGALAIGFGFGSQNLVNNFISGLILLVERPIRVADLIQVGDLHGNVEHIGLRSTRVRTGNNVEIIVPNSSFLQENVVNWTLTDTQVRIMVAVGVAYGSPTREVKEIMRKSAASHGRVLKSPDPIVLFKNFGDNSLEFEVHFWIQMRSQMDQRIIESDLRYMIDSFCREAGITIAFPQRDVHLDTLQPLDVRILPEESDEAPAPGTSP